MSDGFTCDASLMVENETLKKEVNELTRALGKAYDGEDRLLMCLGSQRASLYKEGLGYTPKKGKAAFAPHKTSFVKNHYYRKLITAGSRTPITDSFGPRWCMSAVIGDLYLRWLHVSSDYILPPLVHRTIWR